MTRKSSSLDPLYLNSIREACLILVLWLAAGIFTVSWCYFGGYLTHEPDLAAAGPDLVDLLGPFERFDRDPDSLTTPLGLGIPDWIFYGVVLPWLACIGLTFWFCLKYFSEDDLENGESPGETGKDP